MLPISTILDKINHQDKNTLDSEEFNLSLVIGDKKVKSGIWTVTPEGSKNLSFGSVENWGGESGEELIVTADSSIASAVSKLPQIEGNQPTKVILGLPEHWVEGNAIQKEKLKILENVCKKLLLKPMGFVVTSEAIAHFLKKNEGGLPSAILLSVGEVDVVVSLIANGKFLGSKVVGRSDNLALDLEEGLLRFDYQGVLPNRILLVNDKDLGDIEEIKQTLVAYPWIGPESKKLNFLQLPKVEEAEEDLEIKAVVLAGSGELGITKETKVPQPEEVIKPQVQEISEPVQQSSEPELGSEPVLQSEELIEENFGFIKEADILETDNIKKTEEVKAETPAPPFVSQTTLEKQPEEQSIKLEKKRFSFSFFGKIIRAIKVIIPRKRRLTPEVNIIQSPHSSLKIFRPLLLTLLILLSLSAISAFLFFQFAKAEIKVFVRPLVLEKEFDFTVSSKIQTVDPGKMEIPAQEVRTDVSGQKSAQVTGRKTVGDKAKGAAVVYNGTDKTKTLTKGVVLKGPGGLKFVLSTEAIVPAKTTDFNATPPVDKWGEKEISVEAVEIGSQYNIAANSTLSLESQPASGSSFLVKNTAAFSGGTSREIQVVSKEDRDKLQKSLLDELSAKAKSEIEGKISSGNLVPESQQLKTKTDKYNHEVQDETSNLSLDTKATFFALFFKNEDFQVLVGKVLADEIPAEYQKTPQEKEVSFEVKDKTKGIFKAKIKAKFVPQIETVNLPTALKGKNISRSEDYLRQIKSLQGFEIQIKPNFFSKLKRLPFQEKNITVKMENI